MEYIVNSLVNLVEKQSPSKETETIIRIDGFEDLRIYERFARHIKKSFENTDLIVDIKLTKTKMDALSEMCNDTTVIQSMKQNDWVITTESVTYYRNLHSSDLLILLGTELEEDKGGLMNCFTVTPDSLINLLNKSYSRVFRLDEIGFADTECKTVDNLFKNLFAYVPIDICKLSDLADKWNNSFNNLQEFIELIYSNLAEWGLPGRKHDFPSVSKINSSKNVFNLEHSFITRTLFNKLNKTQYKKYLDQIEKYDVEGGVYASSWEEWKQQDIKSYDEFSSVLKGFILGEEVENNTKKFLATDFAVVEAIFGVDIKGEKKERSTVNKLIGEPLEVFTKAILMTLTRLMLESQKEIEDIEIRVKKAEISLWSANSDDEDMLLQLSRAWKSICRHTNGVVEFINSYSWRLGDTDIEIRLEPEGIFDPNCTNLNIDTSGIISAASSNKSVNKILFDVLYRGDDKKKKKIEFQWMFDVSNGWNHYFNDLCEQDFAKVEGNNIIPLVIVDKLNSLLFSKSSEEFFDAYEERSLDFSFNICEFIDAKKTNNALEYAAQFDKVGKAFAQFAYDVAKDGYYSVLLKDESSIKKLIKLYGDLGEYLTKKTIPENLKWILDAYIHAFNIESSNEVLVSEKDISACIVPPWHPATLEKMNDQKIFFLDGCYEWWNQQLVECKPTLKEASTCVDDLREMSTIQSAVDLFPSYDSSYFGSKGSYEAFSLYGRKDIENNNRLKDMIHKDAIYDDDFDKGEIKHFNDNAKMIFCVLNDYIKAFPNAYRNLNIVFLDPSELQPIISALYRFVEVEKKNHGDNCLNIGLKILVKPENKGGRNYLAYWMDEFFSQDSNVNIHMYLNEYETKSDLERLLDGNNDIVFAMDILQIDSLKFIKDSQMSSIKTSECRFPIVYKPSPISDTSVKRKIELSQPQFRAAFEHTQVVRFRNNLETLPQDKYIAYKEVRIAEEAQDIVDFLHTLAYWVVCIDSGMDGALLRTNNALDKYQIIGFSTGKGEYGQYNLTVTARRSILETIEQSLNKKLYDLFKWDNEKIIKASKLCINEASGLDGISLLSAVNPRDRNINEFMAYVLTSLIEKNRGVKNALKIVVHLDSYKHWFSGEIEKDSENTKSRPDFLVLEANINEQNKLILNATIVECKIAGVASADIHKSKAIEQVSHGIRRLSEIFDPNSSSIKRRYWFAQLYRALVFAQVTFSDNSSDFAEMSSKLRAILDGDFEVNWQGQVLGFWLDLNTENIIETPLEDGTIKVYDIPQLCVQKLLLENNTLTAEDYVLIDDKLLRDAEEEEADIQARIRSLKSEMQIIQNESRRDKVKRQSNQEVNSVVKTGVLETGNETKNHSTNEVAKCIEEEKIAGIVSSCEMLASLEEDESVKNDINVVETINEETLIDLQDNIDLSIQNLEEVRVLVGKNKLEENVYWEFGNKNLANRHLLITGTSGQGKTYSIQTLLYELSKSNISAVVFDYTEGFRVDQLEEKFVSLMGNKIKQNIVYSTGVPINPFKRHEIDVAGMTIIEKAADVANRIANIFTHVYGFGEQQYAAIFEAARMGIEEYKEQMNMAHFYEKLEEVKSINNAAKTVISKMTPFFHSIEFTEDAEFDWSKILYAEEAILNIFQLTLIDREMQVVITELMLWDAWYFTKKYGNKGKPFVVVLDEAQNLSHKMNSPSAAILTEGRKFGWSAWFATQSIKILSDDEVVRLMQAAFKLYFKPTDEEVTKMAKQLDPTDGNAWLSSLKNLKKGQCIVVGERIKPSGEFGQVKPTITSITSFDERM